MNRARGKCQFLRLVLLLGCNSVYQIRVLAQEWQLQWAVLGTGRAAQRVVPHLKVEVVGTRAPGSQFAKQFVDALAPGARLDSYAAAVGDARVKAVYIALPTAMKDEWALQAVRFGKHVLVEKPCGANEASARRLAEACAAHGVVCLDGTSWLHHPKMNALQAHRRGVVSAAGHFEIQEPLLDDIRMNPLQEPMGVVGDLCWHAVGWIYWVFGRPPRNLKSRVSRGATGVPVRADVDFLFGNGQSAFVRCAFGSLDLQHGSMDSSTSMVDFSSWFDDDFRKELGGIMRHEHIAGNAVAEMVGHFNRRVSASQHGLPQSSIVLMAILDSILQMAEQPNRLLPMPRRLRPSLDQHRHASFASQGFVRLEGWFRNDIELLSEMNIAALSLVELQEHRWQGMFSARSQFTWTRCASCRSFVQRAQLGGIARAFLGGNRIQLVEDAVLDLTDGWPGLHWHLDASPDSGAVFGSLAPKTNGVSLWIPLLVNRSRGGELALVPPNPKCAGKFAAYPDDFECWKHLEEEQILPNYEVGDIIVLDSTVWHRTKPIVGRRLVYFVRFASSNASLLHRHRAMPHCIECQPGRLQVQAFPLVWPESRWLSDMFNPDVLRKCRTGNHQNCWDATYTADLCCVNAPIGNPMCWTNAFSYETCCVGRADASVREFPSETEQCCEDFLKYVSSQPQHVPFDYSRVLAYIAEMVQASALKTCSTHILEKTASEVHEFIRGQLKVPSCLPVAVISAIGGLSQSF